ALARGATRRAATGLVREALLREELLLARREGEGAAAAAAGEDAVRVAHGAVPGGSERSDSAPGGTWRTPTRSIRQRAGLARGASGDNDGGDPGTVQPPMVPGAGPRGPQAAATASHP